MPVPSSAVGSAGARPPPPCRAFTAFPASARPGPKQTALPNKRTQRKTPKPSPRVASGTGSRANVGREYVAGGALVSQYASLTALPGRNSLDGCPDGQVLDAMLLDPEIAKCVRLCKIAVLTDGIKFVPAAKRGEDDFDEAKKYSDFVARSAGRLERKLESVVEGLLDAIVYGHKVAEQTFQVCKVGEDKGLIVHKYVKVKPRDTTAFVVDRYWNVKGLLALNQGRGSSSSMSNPDPASVLPRRKFLVLSIDPKDEDPRGQSLLRAAVNVWDLKQQVWPEYLRWLLQCAVPSLIGYTAEIAPNEQARDENNQPVEDAEGKAVYVTAVDAMLGALVQMRNRSALALPYGAKVETIEAVGDGSAFTRAINLFDEQIDTAILCQTLATREGEHQARAASVTHQSVLEMVIRWLKSVVVDMIESDFVRPLIEWNFGEEALRLAPKVSLGDRKRNDLEKYASAIAALCQSGYLAKSQLPEIDLLLDLPQRADKDDDLVPLRSAEPLPGEPGATVQQEQRATPTDPAPKPATSNSPAEKRRKTGAGSARQKRPAKETPQRKAPAEEKKPAAKPAATGKK